MIFRPKKQQKPAATPQRLPKPWKLRALNIAEKKSAAQNKRWTEKGKICWQSQIVSILPTASFLGKINE